MKRLLLLATLLSCMAASTVTLAQNTGAPPGNVSPKGTTEGRAAGYSGGAGAAGQAGTDPATLSHIEEERVRKQGAASGANGSTPSSSSAKGKRRDWKE